MQLPGRVLPWDSEFWGFRVGQVVEQRLSAVGVVAIEDWAVQEGIDCLYFDGVDEFDTVRRAGLGGFNLVEARLTLTYRRGEGRRSLQAGSDIVVREQREGDARAVRDIAYRTPYVSRFSYDVRFPRERIPAYYAAWLDFADAVFVAEVDNAVAGYITCRLPETGGEARLGIVGVDETVRNRGVSDALMSRGVSWLEDRGMDTVSVDVAARNVATQRYVQRHGFSTTAFRLFFHKWYC